MVKFEFILSDEEAVTLCDLVANETALAEEITRNEALPKAERKWYKARIKYLKDIRAKMYNTRAA